MFLHVIAIIFKAIIFYLQMHIPSLICSFAICLKSYNMQLLIWNCVLLQTTPIPAQESVQWTFMFSLPKNVVLAAG